MSRSQPFAKCMTCGVRFRRAPRQRKCDSCFNGNVFPCCVCGVPYERVDDQRACGPCILTLPTPTDYEGWRQHLKIVGRSMSRGKITTISDLGAPIGPGKITGEQRDQLMEEQNQILEKYAPSDEKPPDFYEQLGVSEDDFLEWFTVAPATHVAARLGIHTEQVQRLRSECMDIPREEVETARIALGYTRVMWQTWKLTKGLVEARIKNALAPLKAAA